MITTYLRPLTDSSSKRLFSAGSVILYQGEAPRSACMIVEGIVRVYTISKLGDEQIVTFYIAGEIFPSSWIFEKSPSTMFFYEALTDCEIAFASREDLLAYITSDTVISKDALTYFATSYSASLLRINALEQARACDKLIYTLYFLSQRYGVTKNGQTYLPIALTHQSIASLIGLTRETTSTEMSKLKKQKVITYKSQMYVLDHEKLLDMIDEDSFRSIAIGA
jgi:CRP-like cAMP-binding protein